MVLLVALAQKLTTYNTVTKPINTTLEIRYAIINQLTTILRLD